MHRADTTVEIGRKMRRLVITLFSSLFITAPALAQPLTGDAKIVHLLNRVSFGIKPGDIQAVKSIGVGAFIDQQLSPENIPESQEVVNCVAQAPALTLTPLELFRQYGPPAQADLKQQLKQASSDDEKQEIKKQIGGFYRNLLADVVRAKLTRALSSPRQLQEVMTDFWFNHFNISVNKGLDHVWLGSYEEHAIRPYALGRFRDLLGATCYHPAMLFYLDNWRNTALPPGESNKENGSNENYARELLELHTLGVDGGYTQKDVTELARVLTGLGFARNHGLRDHGQGQDANSAGKSNTIFNENKHDFGDKLVLGQTIKGSGRAEIDQALDLLARHPSTAKHISYQLAQYFVADNPPAALVNRMTQTFLQSDGDIRKVLQTMFHSPEFWDSKYANSKYKNPFRYLASTMRAIQAEPQNIRQALNFLKLQGMPLYACLTPDGYKNTESAWLNSDALLKRINFVTALSLHQIPLADDKECEFEPTFAAVSKELSDKTLAAAKEAPDQLRVAVLLGSPDFMKY
jgi:uncharacterized protein (DUF1800 family)